MIFDDAKEKNKHAVATPEDQNTLHSLKIPRLPLSTQSTYLVKRKPSETTWSRTILFCISRKVDCWVWVFGGHDSSPCSQQLTNQIWTRICIPTVFLFCHGMLTWLRQEFRPRIVKRNIYAALRASTNNFFFWTYTFYNKRKETHDRNSESLAFTNISFLFKIQYIWWEGCCIHKASSSPRVSRSSNTQTDRSKNAHLHSSSDVCYCLRITGFPFFWQNCG